MNSYINDVIISYKTHVYWIAYLTRKHLHYTVVERGNGNIVQSTNGPPTEKEIYHCMIFLKHASLCGFS